MAIRAIRRKCHNDMWLYATDMRYDPADNCFRVSLIHIAIDIIKETHFTKSEGLCRAAQFCFSDLGNSLQARIWSLGIEPASLPARRADEVGFDTFRGITRQR